MYQDSSFVQPFWIRSFIMKTYWIVLTWQRKAVHRDSKKQESRRGFQWLSRRVVETMALWVLYFHLYNQRKTAPFVAALKTETLAMSHMQNYCYSEEPRRKDKAVSTWCRTAKEKLCLSLNSLRSQIVPLFFKTTRHKQTAWVHTCTLDGQLANYCTLEMTSCDGFQMALDRVSRKYF